MGRNRITNEERIYECFAELELAAQAEMLGRLAALHRALIKREGSLGKAASNGEKREVEPARQ
jgi:hypothetical protein